MRNFFVLMLLLGGATAFAQHRMTLEDLSEFRPQAGNWQVVGEVEMHPFKPLAEESEKVRKRKRRKSIRKRTSLSPEEAVRFETGTGILLNLNTEEKKDALLTEWEHGDLYLEMEVMLPEGSNSGIYLQGRYEIQLYDSWGVRNPKFSDMGGVFRNWKETPGEKFMGIPPSSNPSRAPGLWQQLKIHFRAPRFNDYGEKVENARLVFVELNGITIHDNVEIPLPTGGPVSDREVATGPLMIQGDHGPVAFRNIKYVLYQPSRVSLSGLRYRAFEGEIESLSQLDSLEHIYVGETEKIEVGVVQTENNYGLIYEGLLEIPEPGDYTFELGFTGGGRLIVNGQTFIEHPTSWDHGVLDHTRTFEAGNYPIRIEAIKTAGWYPPRLGLWVKTAKTEARAFHTEESFSRTSYLVPRIPVEPGNRPRMLRGFVRFGGGDDKRSHTIAVGTGTGVHYVYDLNKGNVLGMWRGDFVDATPMWRDRGDGSFQPGGSVCWTHPGQVLLAPGDKSNEFAEKHRHPDFVPLGYRLEQESGLPVFEYRYGKFEVSHMVTPSEGNRSLLQHIQFRSDEPINEPGTDLMAGTTPSYVYKLAEGDVQRLDPRTFRINDAYYVRIQEGPEAFERNTELGTELCVPVTGAEIKYEILW